MAFQVTSMAAIAQGGFASLYTGKDMVMQDTVALKIRSEQQADPRQLLREIRILRLVRHENVVDLRDAFRCNFHGTRSVCIVMPFVNSTLHDAIYTSPLRAFLVERRSSVLFQMLSACQYLHNHGIIHRDLKPDNVLLHFDMLAKRLEVKMADFNLSRSITRASNVTSNVAVLAYQAPEILFEMNYGNGVDIWSIGCILAEIIKKSRLLDGFNDRRKLLRAMIFWFGTPGEHIVSSASTWARKTIEQLRLPIQAAKPIRSLLPEAPRESEELLREDELQLIGQMLQIDPRNRRSCSELLNLPFFYPFRRFRQEAEHSAELSNAVAAIEELDAAAVSQALTSEFSAFDRSRGMPGLAMNKIDEAWTSYPAVVVLKSQTGSPRTASNQCYRHVRSTGTIGRIPRVDQRRRAIS